MPDDNNLTILAHDKPLTLAMLRAIAPVPPRPDMLLYAAVTCPKCRGTAFTAVLHVTLGALTLVCIGCDFDEICVAIAEGEPVQGVIKRDT